DGTGHTALPNWMRDQPQIDVTLLLPNEELAIEYAKPRRRASSCDGFRSRERTMLRVLMTVALLLLCIFAPKGWAQSGGPASSSPTSRRGNEAASPVSDPHSESLPQTDGPVKGSNEWQAWVGGAYPIQPFGNGPTARIWSAGATYGRGLTDAHGPGPLRGRFEWAFEVAPVVEILQPRYRVYGA